ncbi:MAG: hypothetical protein N2109_03730 [Fimbriimonadales bacterium]|nr:hypothetical protein [Fimbriimonadales bacterium]
METVRYRPGEVLQWLEVGAVQFRRNARDKGSEALRRHEDAPVSANLRAAAEAAVDLGKGALAELARLKAERTEYILGEHSFEAVQAGRLRSIRYDAVQSIVQKGDTYHLHLANGRSLAIRPPAHLLVGRLKVPVGWIRNGLQVPYSVLADELAARCGVNIQPS